MDYNEFLKTKQKTNNDAGFEIDPSELNKNLFPFQSFIVQTALKKGKYAVFADCGLGKTIMQLDWAYQVACKTNKPVLILCPLAVSKQTISEGEKFGVDVNHLIDNAVKSGVHIINYDQLDNIDASIFSGVVLDESSILKNFVGKTKTLILDKFADTPYKLACTATPSPNDHIELGNHAEFLNVMSQMQMVSIFFINDAFNKDKSAPKWRLKKHSEDNFWNWVSSWSMMVNNPADIGFDDNGYKLPELKINELSVKVEKQDNGKLFNDTAVSSTTFYAELKKSIINRCNKVAELVNASTENFIIWVKTDDEQNLIKSLIPGSVSVSGSDKKQIKEDRLLGFGKNEFRVLITKTKIAQFGLNYQNCHNQVFLSFDFSFEGLYQAIRRSWRFGQKEQVNIYLVTIETMGNVLKNIKDKQVKFENMQNKMRIAMQQIKKEINLTDEKFNSKKGKNWELINGDSIIYLDRMKENSVHHIFFSPPFADLYMFSNDPKDVSNNTSYDDFFTHFEFMMPKLLKVLKEGRLCAMHCTQLAKTKGKDGKLEIIDFRGDLIRAMQRNGFDFHAETTIWKDPKIIAQRTKNHQLLHATTKKDSCVNRMGFADYMLWFKKPGENLEPVNHDKNGLPFDRWCKIAEPVWMDIDAGDVLKAKDAKADKDEKHMTPTQREPIKRSLELYTNPGDIVFSPFSGWGTEGTVSVLNKRKFIGVELKESYFTSSIKNLKDAEFEIETTQSLF